MRPRKSWLTWKAAPISLRDPNWRLLAAGALLTIVGVGLFLFGFGQARLLEGQTHISAAGETSTISTHQNRTQSNIAGAL